VRRAWDGKDPGADFAVIQNVRFMVEQKAFNTLLVPLLPTSARRVSACGIPSLAARNPFPPGRSGRAAKSALRSAGFHPILKVP
jgi:hypothetical protein